MSDLEVDLMYTNLPHTARTVLDAALIKIEPKRSSRDCQITTLLRPGRSVMKHLGIDPHKLAVFVCEVEAMYGRKRFCGEYQTNGIACAKCILTAKRVSREIRSVGRLSSKSIEILEKLLCYVAGKESIDDILAEDDIRLKIEGTFEDWKLAMEKKLERNLAIAARYCMPESEVENGFGLEVVFGGE